MRIVGIDPGLRATGYGFIDCHNQAIKLLETGTIEPSIKESFPNRIYKIHTILKGLVDQYQPDVLVLEKLYSHQQRPMIASILGHVRGAVCLVCAEKKLELIEYSVKRIRKAVTGNGNASKLQTQQVVMHLLNIKQTKIALDASDAMALAVGYTRINSREFIK
jgi:crossover junction endodeoxyribonuclease RuvC